MLDPDNKGTTILHSVRSFSPNDRVSPYRKPQTSPTPLQEPQILWCHTTFNYTTTISFHVFLTLYPVRGHSSKPTLTFLRCDHKQEISTINKVYWTTNTKAVGNLIMMHCAFVEISCCSSQEILSDLGGPPTTVPVGFRASVALQTTYDPEKRSPNLLAVQASGRYAQPTLWGACPTIWRTLLCS